MDGKTLSKKLTDMLNEDFSTSLLYNARTGYEYLNDAATELVNITRSLTGDTTITTVADRTTYTLPANFLELSLKDDEGRPFMTYSDGTNTSKIFLAREEDVIFDNNTTSVLIPGRFYLEDFELTTKTDTGTATSAGDAAAGKCTLTDTSATFETTDVSPYDTIHNTTDGSTGYVLSVTSETALVCALFDGTDNEWDSSDAYTIVMQPRMRIVLAPPPSTADHTITLNGYIRSPSPVYSDYDAFGIKSEFTTALVSYAAWMYRYQDRVPDEGDRFFLKWDRQMRLFRGREDAKKSKSGYRVITRINR
jgi:hypothetical protein